MRTRHPAADDDRDGREVVVERLRALANPPQIDANQAADWDALTDVLLDYGHEFDGTELLYLLTCVQVHRFDERARDLFRSECWLLDPRAIGEESLVHTYTQFIDGRRRKPFRVWSLKIVRDVVRRARSNAAVAPLRIEGVSTSESLVMAEIARLNNLQDIETRRVLWQAWVELMTPGEISRATGIPLERVELIVASVLAQARRAVRDAFGLGGPGSGRDDAFGGERGFDAGGDS